MSYNLRALAKFSFVEEMSDTELVNAFLAFRDEVTRRHLVVPELPALSEEEKALARGLAGLNAVGSYHRRTGLNLVLSQQAVDDYRFEFEKAGGKIAQWPDSGK